jgi:hypothetical protein
MPKLQEKPTALKREHPALQNMKILYFFLFLWVIFALLDPDPDRQFECGSGYGYGSGSATLGQGMVFFLEITNVWQKSRDIWLADFLLRFFKSIGWYGFTPMDFWLF